MTEVDFRRGTADDNEPCFAVFIESVVDLSRRIGAPWEPDPADLWTRLEPMYRHLGGQAAEWWVAHDAGDAQLIGYARSVERGGLFELTEFFVRPSRQSAGVGRRLLELAFPPIGARCGRSSPRRTCAHCRATTGRKRSFGSRSGRSPDPCRGERLL